MDVTMSRKSVLIISVGIVALMIICFLSTYIYMDKKNKEVDKLTSELQYNKKLVTSMGSLLQSDSLYKTLNIKNHDQSIIIKYKVKTIKKDSLVYINSDVIEQEGVFSKHTLNY